MGVRGDLEAVRERFIEQGLQILSDIPPNRDSLFQLFGCRELLVPFVGAGLSVDHGFPEWKPLLRAAADYMASRTGHDRRSEIDALLDRDQYEEAAEQLEALDSAVFDGFIGTTFSRPGPRYGATRRLPKIAGGLVITTNLDTVIERAFGCVYPVLRGVAIGGLLNRSIQLGEPLILKLHGDHSEPQTRILTQTAYARAYCIGNDVAKGVDPEKPLPKVLARVYGARPLLFLGCSLRADRTTHVLETIMADFEGTEHFALLEEPSPAECDQRLRQLQSWHIRPLFFRRGDFDCIEQFLDVLGNHTSITARATASRTYFLIAPTCPPKNGSYQGRLKA